MKSNYNLVTFIETDGNDIFDSLGISKERSDEIMAKVAFCLKEGGSTNQVLEMLIDGLNPNEVVYAVWYVGNMRMLIEANKTFCQLLADKKELPAFLIGLQMTAEMIRLMSELDESASKYKETHK